MTSFIHLNEHVGRVLVPNLPTDDDAFLVCLTSQEVHIIRAFVFPYATWRTRFVRWVQDNLFETATDEELSAYQEKLEALDDTLGGALMPCSDIKEGLEAIAAALAGLQPVTQNVTCGGGGGSNPACSGVLGAIAGMDPGQVIPQTPIEEPDPEGDPPEGFDSWEEYYTRKCQASYALFAWMRNFLTTMQSASGAAQNLASAVGIAQLIMIVIGIALDPIAMAGLAAAVLAVLLISTDALIKISGAVDYLDTHKDEIICAFYNSGSALDVQQIATSAIEDAVQAIEWGSVFAPLGEALETAIAAVGSQLLSNNVVNVLFYAAEDVVLPEAECNCGTTGWHFDASSEGWSAWEDERNDVHQAAQWQASPSPQDPGDSSAGCLESVIDLPEGGYSWYNGGWRIAGSVLPSAIAHTGDSFICRAYKSTSAGAPKMFAVIRYSDDSTDYEYHDSHSWETITVAVSSGNNGKTIAYLEMTVYPDATERNPVTFYFDHASWVAL